MCRLVFGRQGKESVIRQHRLDDARPIGVQVGADLFRDAAQEQTDLWHHRHPARRIGLPRPRVVIVGLLVGIKHDYRWQDVVADFALVADGGGDAAHPCHRDEAVEDLFPNVGHQTPSSIRNTHTSPVSSPSGLGRRACALMRQALPLIVSVPSFRSPRARPFAVNSDMRI
jgi:hypothetical protein